MLSNQQLTMLYTLSQLGCRPAVNYDGTLSLQCQGENFRIEFRGMSARISLPMWAGIKADDPELPQIREAVNATNFNFGPTVVLTAPNDKGVIDIHCHRDIMLHPAPSDNKSLIKAALVTFFNTKEKVCDNLRQIKAKQMKASKTYHPKALLTSPKDE